MYGFALTMFFLISLVGLSMQTTMDAAEAKYDQDVQMLAENVSGYMSLARSFRSTHPSYSGQVSDASLGLPSWMGKREAMQLIVQGGKGYIYLPIASESLMRDAAFYIRERTELASYGKKHGNQVMSADGEVIVVPSQIPEGWFVFVI